MRPWSVTNTREYTNVATPLFQTCSEIGGERDEFSPIKEINIPREASHSLFLFLFFFVFFYAYVYYAYVLYTRYICYDPGVKLSIS